MKTLLIGVYDDTNALAILLCAQTQKQQQQNVTNQIELENERENSFNDLFTDLRF